MQTSLLIAYKNVKSAQMSVRCAFFTAVGKDIRQRAIIGGGRANIQLYRKNLYCVDQALHVKIVLKFHHIPIIIKLIIVLSYLKKGSIRLLYYKSYFSLDTPLRIADIYIEDNVK